MPHGRGPRGMPQYVWRKHRVWYVILAISLFVLFTGFPIRGYWVTCVSVTISLASGTLLFCSRRAIRKKMFATNLEMCLACAYPLTGLAQSGECPECGMPFARTEVRDAWKRWRNA